jgi:hypothetical protein
MNDNIAPQKYQEDDTPTKPVGKPADSWEMPTPVFRQSSGGTLPRRLGLDPDSRSAAAAAPAEQPPAAAAAPEQAVNAVAAKTAAAVAEQPDLSADFSLPEDVTPPVEKRKIGAAKMVFIVLGLAGILLLIGIFLAVIYFLFFSRITEPQTF